MFSNMYSQKFSMTIIHTLLSTPEVHALISLLLSLGIKLHIPMCLGK